MSEPTVMLNEDGESFVWFHECEDVPAKWRDAGNPLTDEEAQHFQESANFRTLPLGGENGWTLVKTEPLEISPSLLCGNCGVHGFFIEGKWVGV